MEWLCGELVGGVVVYVIVRFLVGFDFVYVMWGFFYELVYLEDCGERNNLEVVILMLEC